MPLHVEYDLTTLGHSAAVPLRLLRTWVEDNIDNTTHGTPDSTVCTHGAGADALG